MLKFYVHNHVTQETKGILTDEEIDKLHLDIRSWDIIPVNAYNKMKRVVPSSVLEVYLIMQSDEKLKEGDVVYTCEDKRYKRVFFPIFHPRDLDKLYLTASGHYILTESLDHVQQAWNESKREAHNIFG